MKKLLFVLGSLLLVGACASSVTTTPTKYIEGSYVQVIEDTAHNNICYYYGTLSCVHNTNN